MLNDIRLSLRDLVAVSDPKYKFVAFYSVEDGVWSVAGLTEGDHETEEMMASITKRFGDVDFVSFMPIIVYEGKRIIEGVLP